ncbi:MAG TPA: AI-2E family transporter [Cyclobacteriaceae bacterium]|mgnify:CR=1 FL=1|nr:AI-2E family transporter [Cyclobacteriaceae bacterium]HRJ80810.1 AI-2E family transporter [Cyclobacteriaceae bacterium]
MDQPDTRPFKVERIASWFVILAILIFCLNYFSNFLQPIVIAVMIWYGVYELKRILAKLKIKGKALPNWLLTLFAFLIIFLISIGIFEILTSNLELIIKKSPEYAENFKNMISGLQTLDGFQDIQQRIVSRAKEFDVQPLLTGFLNSLTNIAGNTIVIIIYVAFLLVEEKYFSKKLHAVTSNSEKQEKVDVVMDQVTQAIRKYISVKTQMSLLTGVLSYVLLLLFDVDFPVLWAFLIFLLNFIPYIGSFIATALPSVFAMFQFQSFAMLFWVFIVIQAVQLLVGNVLEPKIMGRTLNLSPLGVMLALTFWGVIWGILGMFLSVPITSVMLITFSRFESTRFIAVWLSETGELDNS